MMKELETVASTTGAKKNRTAILSVSERGAKLGQRIKSLVANILDRFSRITTKYFVLWHSVS